MRLVQIFTIIAFLTVACKSTIGFNKIEQHLSLQVINKGTYGVTQCDSAGYILLDLRLINKTDSVCEFITKSCATIGNILTDPEQVEFCPIYCSSNSIIAIQINPGQDFTVPVILKFHVNISDIDSVKFGIVLFPPELLEHMDFNEGISYLKKNRINIIWSDPIKLYALEGNPFEIR